MRPLKSEIQKIAALLVEGGDSPEQLAAEVIEAIDAARAERVTYFAVLRFGNAGKPPLFTGFGPFSTPNQAEKAIQKHPAAGMATAYAVVPTLNGNGLDELIASVDTPAKPHGDWVEVKRDQEAKRNGWRGKAADRDKYLGESA